MNLDSQMERQFMVVQLEKFWWSVRGACAITRSSSASCSGVTLHGRPEDSAMAWQRVALDHWYGERRRTVEITSGTAVWYHGGLPVLPIRWGLIRDPKGMFKWQALLCTDLAVKPEQILKWCVLCWRVEVTFQEIRAPLSVETQRQWNDG